MDPMHRRRTVALVLPARNEAPSVFMTLDSLYAGVRIPDEIVVVDGRSDDGTREEVARYVREHARPEICVVDNPELWVGYARNRGIAATRSEILLFADFGNAFDPHWVAEMVRPFEEDPSVDLVAGLFRPLVTSEFEHCMAAVHYFEDYQLEDYAPGDLEALLPAMVVPGGMSIGATRAICERLGAFPAWLFKGQDKLFGRKAVALGAKVRVAWRAFVQHHMRSSPRAVFEQLYFYMRGFGQQRYLNRMAVKLGLLYAVVLLLLALSPLHPAFAVAAVLLFCVHVWWHGWRKLLALRNKRKPQPMHVWHTLTALVARDLGCILGHAAGWIGWATEPELRRRFAEYMRDCDPAKITLVAR